MGETDDSSLLRQFIATRDEHAFATIVRRHVDLVYSAARRQTRGDDASAGDVTQQVFVLLAEKARTLRDGEALAGWLLVTTRFVALNHIRAEARRRRNEHEAAVMQQQSRSAEPSSPQQWERIGPMLDEAVAKLKREDRDALALRYFQNRSVADVAAALGVSQDAAQKRIGRAIERLRELFARRGVTTSAEALSSVLLANALVTAPATLTTGVAGAALTSAAATATTTSTKGLLSIMGLANGKLVAASVAAVVLVGVTGTIAYQTVATPRGAARQVQVDNSGRGGGGNVGGRMGGGQMSGCGSRPPGAMPPPAAEPLDPNWRAPFENLYKLKPNENLKLVRPPFIPQRLDFYRTGSVRGQSSSMPEGPDAFVITQTPTGELRTQMSRFGDPYSGRDALRAAVGIAPRELELSNDFPADLLDRPMPGDWVIRQGGSTEAKLADFLRALVGRPVAVTRQTVERDVIVISGTFAYRGLNGAAPAAGQPRKIHFFLGQPDATPSHGGGTGSYVNALERVGDSTGYRVVRESPKFGERSGVEFATHRSFMDAAAEAKRTNNGVFPPAQLDDFLANLSKQTSLNIRRERRAVGTWVTVPAAAATTAPTTQVVKQ
jgi:RNA polymerase sigma factor (sigma-70 family)